MWSKIQLVTSSRFLHIFARYRAVDKSQLSKLRKKTGFPFINCKKALEKFDNDFAKAEKWMREEAQREGWAKASKLQDRPLSQGLIGFIKENNMATMVEVNCETDFVSRNKKFCDLVAEAATVCLQHGQKTNGAKLYWSSEAVNGLTTEDGKTLGDAVALAVGKIGENMGLRRGVYLQAQQGASIGHYLHSSGDTPKDKYCLMGKFGSLVAFHKSEASTEVLSSQTTDDVGRQLCQHIVGMNPKALGYDVDMPNKDKDSETNLIHQEFLLEPSLTVGEYLEEKGLKVLDFVRFECGEEEEVEVTQQVQKKDS